MLSTEQIRIEQRPLIRHGYWYLVPTMVRQELSSKYRQSGLQMAWAVVQPASIMLVFAFFFGGVLDIGDGQLPYLSFIACGLVPWRLYSGVISGSGEIIRSLEMMSKTYFPREIFPIARMGTVTVDFIISAMVGAVFIAVQGATINHTYVALPIVVLLLYAVTLWTGIVASALVVFVRDLDHAIPVILQVLFFATPLMYEVGQIPKQIRWLTDLNPLAVLVESSRRILLEARYPEWHLLLPHLVVALVMVVAALAYTRSVEHRMVDVA